MNQGRIERIEHHAGSVRYRSRAFVRICVGNEAGRLRCWVDVEATNYAIRPRQRVWWRDGKLYWEPAPLRPLVELELLGQGKEESL